MEAHIETIQWNSWKLIMAYRIFCLNLPQLEIHLIQKKKKFLYFFLDKCYIQPLRYVSLLPTIKVTDTEPIENYDEILLCMQISWWRHQMGSFSALVALCVGNSMVTGEFPSERPVTRFFDVFFDLGLNKRLSKLSRRRWFETSSRSLWRHCNVIPYP